MSAVNTGALRSPEAVSLADTELQELVREGMQRWHVPGIAIGVLHAGADDYATFGVTSVEHPLPVDPDTLFQIASITKTITATVVMRLVERGALALDAPVRRYLPQFRLRDEDAASRATVRHLLTHTSGWLGDCFADFGSGDDAIARYVEAMAELEQITPLGEIWHYSNSSFTLLGRLIEVATGKAYEAATSELLLEPLGMTTTCFSAGEAITHRVAMGHVVVEERPVVARPWAFPRATTPVGGIVSSVRDLLRYARFHLGDGTVPGTEAAAPVPRADAAADRLLSEASLRLMGTPQVRADLDRSVGIAWFIRDIGGVRFQYHGGAAIGQQGVLQLAPERDYAIAVQTNSGRGALLHEAVTKWAQRRYLGVEQPAPTRLDLSADQAAAYVGHYTAELSDAHVELVYGRLRYRSVSHNKLGVRPKPDDPPPAPMEFRGVDTFVCTEGPLTDLRGEFLRGPGGEIRFMRVGGRVYRRA